MATKRDAGINALVLCVDQVAGEGLSSILRENPGISGVFHCNNAEQCAAVLRRSDVQLAVIDDEAADHWSTVYDGFARHLASLCVILVRNPANPPREISINGCESQLILRGPDAAHALIQAVNNVLDARREAPPESPSLDSEAVAQLQRLTLAEQTVLKMLARGLSTKEIAGSLFVSPRTVETHRAQITTKLSIRSIAGLTKFAIRAGIATLRD